MKKLAYFVFAPIGVLVLAANLPEAIKKGSTEEIFQTLFAALLFFLPAVLSYFKKRPKEKDSETQAGREQATVSSQTQAKKEDALVALFRKKKLLALTAIVIAIGFGLKFYFEETTKKEMHRKALQVLQSMPEYKREKKVIDFLLHAEHPKAFNKAFRKGGRKQAARFNEKKYWYELFTQMGAQAKLLKREDLEATFIGYAKKFKAAEP